MLFPASAILISEYSIAAIPELTLSPSTPPSSAATRFSSTPFGRIADPGIDIPFDFQIKQRRSMLGAVELKRDSLVDRHGHGFRRGIAVVARVNCDRFSLHFVFFIFHGSDYVGS